MNGITQARGFYSGQARERPCWVRSKLEEGACSVHTRVWMCACGKAGLCPWQCAGDRPDMSGPVGGQSPEGQKPESSSPSSPTCRKWVSAGSPNVPSRLPSLQGPPQPAGAPGLRRLPRVCQSQPGPGPQVSSPCGVGGTNGRGGGGAGSDITSRTAEKHPQRAGAKGRKREAGFVSGWWQLAHLGMQVHFLVPGAAPGPLLPTVSCITTILLLSGPMLILLVSSI